MSDDMQVPASIGGTEGGIDSRLPAVEERLVRLENGN